MLEIRARARALFFAFALSAAAAARAEEGSLCRLENGRFRVELVGETLCCPNVLSIELFDKESGRGRVLELETGVRKSGHISMVGPGRLLITGQLERGAQALLLVDLDAGRLLEEIRVFDFRLSPSRRRLVASRWFPSHTPPEEQGALLSLHELAADPAGGARAGRPIYPEANAERGSHDPRLEPPHRLLSPLLFSEDERLVVFFERFRDKLWLVSVDITAEPARTRRREVGLAELSGSGLAPAAGALPIVTLAWQDPTTLTLQAFLDDGLQEAVPFEVP